VCFMQDQQTEFEQLSAENSSLRARLHDVTHSPLSDSEKEQLLLATTGRQHSSAPASIMATELQGDLTLADTSCSTPDWDKQSNSSLSEVSVACLQDRIMQMEETHYRCVYHETWRMSVIHVCVHGHAKSVCLCHHPTNSWQQNSVMRFEVLLAVNIITDFWGVMLYNLVTSSFEQGSSMAKMQGAHSKMLTSVSWCHIPGNHNLQSPFN
jgi:hypothetical protein